MDRRDIIIAGLAATFTSAASSTSAQTQPAVRVGLDIYVQQTLLVGKVSLAAAQIAAERATDDNVRQFAQLEAAEQQTIAAILASVPAGKNVPTRLPAQQAELDRLEGLEAGREFDLAFVEGQIGVHNDLLRIQQTASGNRDPTVEVITARMSEQAVASHITMLGLIQQMLASQEIQNIQDGKNPDGSTSPQGEQPSP